MWKNILDQMPSVTGTTKTMGNSWHVVEWCSISRCSCVDRWPGLLSLLSPGNCPWITGAAATSGNGAGNREPIMCRLSRKVHSIAFPTHNWQTTFKSLYLETNRKCMLIVNNLNWYSCQLLRGHVKGKKKRERETVTSGWHWLFWQKCFSW